MFILVDDMGAKDLSNEGLVFMKVRILSKNNLFYKCFFIIARRESKRPTRQSIVSRGMRMSCLFDYRLTVDRHGLSPRHDKAGTEW